MRTVELFAGSCSFTKVAKSKGFETFTTDIINSNDIDYSVDIMLFDAADVPFIPDVIWASPDCATWSKAAGNLHYDSKSMKPKTEKAKQAILHIEKMLNVIDYFLKLNPALLYYIENPVGKLINYLKRGSLFEPGFNIPRVVTIDQCQYGREYMKPTHIFTNDLSWIPRERCKGGKSCNHKKNIKNAGSGKKNQLASNRYYKRAEVASELFYEILK